jgi:hypothetical protein
MKHITFTIHEKYVEYHMDNNCGSHPLANSEPPQKVIDYIAKLCNADSVEIIE